MENAVRFLHLKALKDVWYKGKWVVPLYLFTFLVEKSQLILLWKEKKKEGEMVGLGVRGKVAWNLIKPLGHWKCVFVFERLGHSTWVESSFRWLQQCIVILHFFYQPQHWEKKKLIMVSCDVTCKATYCFWTFALIPSPDILYHIMLLCSYNFDWYAFCHDKLWRSFLSHWNISKPLIFHSLISSISFFVIFESLPHKWTDKIYASSIWICWQLT